MDSFYESHIDLIGKDLAVNLYLSHVYADGMIHWHENLELLYFIKGECNVLSGSDEVHVVPGDIVVINSGDLHAVKCNNNPCDFVIVQLDFAFCEDMGFDLTNKTLKKKIRDEEMGRLILDAVEIFKNKDEYYKQELKIFVSTILLKCFKKYFDTENGKGESQTKKILSKKIVKFARHNFDEDITVDDIAKHCGYSRFYVSKVFKEVTGKTLVDFINCLKIDKAKSLLRNSTYGMSEIASRCGFASQSYFSNVFKRYEKLSPYEYRANIQKQVYQK